jgi:hypothetical protein
LTPDPNGRPAALARCRGGAARHRADALGRRVKFSDLVLVGASYAGYAAAEAREFNGALCSIWSNAFWLRRLARMLHRPVVGYVTELRHAFALWSWWRQLLPLAGVAPPAKAALPATAIRFRAGHRIPRASYCDTTLNAATGDLVTR